METLVVVNRNHHYYNGRSRKRGSSKFTSSGSPDGFLAVNCRGFELGSGLLPAPSKTKTSTPVKETQKGLNRSRSSLPVKSFVASPKTLLVKETQKGLNRSSISLPVKSFVASPKTPSSRETQKGLKRSSSSLSPIKIELEGKGEGLNFFERWAGPAYSNSPPPSSLPMPKFSMRPKRSASVELPSKAEKSDLRPMAKSAPTSPRRERSPSPSDVFDGSDCATNCLRRMLNLDIGDQ